MHLRRKASTGDEEVELRRGLLDVWWNKVELSCGFAMCLDGNKVLRKLRTYDILMQLASAATLTKNPQVKIISSPASQERPSLTVGVCSSAW